MIKCAFRWILFAALCALFAFSVSANETEEEEEIGEDYYYYENEDELVGTESLDENGDTNSTKEEDYYDQDSALDLENALKMLQDVQEASQELPQMSANETEEEIGDDYNYYYGDEDDLEVSESIDENIDTNSTKDDYDHDSGLDFEKALKMLQDVQEASEKELIVPRSSQCGTGPSRILAQVDRGDIDPLELSMDDIATYANNTEILDCIHIIKNMKAIKDLISVLPDEILRDIASRPGLFEKLSDDAVVAFAENVRALAAVDVGTLLEVANKRPHTIGKRLMGGAVVCELR